MINFDVFYTESIIKITSCNAYYYSQKINALIHKELITMKTINTDKILMQCHK